MQGKLIEHFADILKIVYAPRILPVKITSNIVPKVKANQ